MTRRSLASALVLVAALSLGSARSRGGPTRAATMATDVASSSSQFRPRPGGAGDVPSSLCPAGMLPDGDACVRLPLEDVGASEEGAPETASAQNAHRDARGRWAVYDEIPRRPDRPADYDAYRYPVTCDRSCVSSGYDLDRPDELQRRGRGLIGGGHRVVGHGAVDLPQAKGAPVVMVTLEHQLGNADVAYVGPLFGTTVITRHTLREGGQLHDYLLLFGHLDAPAPGIQVGSHVKEGDTIGFVGDTGSPELFHLHLEVRRVRSGVDLENLPPGTMIANETSVVCDPRNVLPLKRF